MPAELVLDDIMPEQSKKKVRFANLSTSFVQVAKIGSESDQAEAIARRHIKEMKAEFAQLNKIWRKKNKTAATHPIGTNTGHEETSAPNVTEQQAAPTVPQQPVAPNVAPQQTSRSVPQQSAPRSVPQQQRTTPTIPHPALAHHTPQRRQTRNATSAPTKRRAVSTATSSGGPLPTATAGKYADNSSARWFQSSTSIPPPTQPTVHAPQQPPSAEVAATQTAGNVRQQTTRATRNSSGPGTSSIQEADGVHNTMQEEFVVLNPPRSNTKGRKKGRIPSGIELQAKATTLCSVCGEPGHNAATCSAGLGNRS
jgi:hypothetical protein